MAGDDFIKFCGKVGISAGRAAMSLEWANVEISMGGGNGAKQVKLVTTNGQQLTIAEFAPASGENDFLIILPYDTILAVTKMCSAEQDVSFSIGGGTPARALIEQPFVYAMTELGKATYRVIALSDRFPKFAKAIAKLSFIAGCKVEARTLKEICSTLVVFEQVRTRIAFSKDDDGTMSGAMTFDKMAEEGSAKRIMPVSDVSGEELELDISSRHLAVAVKKAEDEVLDLKFSGKHSLGLLDLGGGVRMYFMPFKN
jgi:DNA polymerase III sliding clamp (beta) subunit (PCNA family)